EKGKQQLQWIHPKTTLSIPKALFLQRVSQDRRIVVMGYSGSDTFDIMPILTASEFGCSGLWVEYGGESLSMEIKEWESNGKNRAILQPKTKEEEKLDVPSKVSRYFLDIFGGSWQDESDENKHPKSLSVSFKSWIDRLRLQPGDGLCCMARLYAQRGKWAQARFFYTTAIDKYEKYMKHTEMRWLVTKSNLGYILEHLDRDQGLEIYTEIQKYIEAEEKQKLYPSVYANILISIAGKWINTVKDIEAGEMVNEAMKIGAKREDKEIMCYGLRVAADRYLGKKEYKEALDIYLRVLQLSSDIFGDIREACKASMAAGICLTNMGAQYRASQMLLHAEMFAKHLGDERLINAVKHNQGFVAGRFRGMSPTLNLHAELAEAAKKQVDDSDAKYLDELMEYIGFEQYDRSLDCINKLLNKYDHPDVQAYLLFLKSNIYQRAQKPKEEIEILKKFCQIKPQHPLAEHNLGLAYSRLKNYNMAEKYFLKAIELMNGYYPLAICNLGIMYVEKGLLEDAKEQLLKAEKLNAPENSLNALRRLIDE
ncbi:MAG: tetratricopeptide repeat protein, partial [Candidatus Zixiibacteriota bacterium]